MLLGIVDGSESSDYYNAMLSLGASGATITSVTWCRSANTCRSTPGRPLLDFFCRSRCPISRPAVTAGRCRHWPDSRSGSISVTRMHTAQRSHVRCRAALLVNASNDAWFGDSLAPHQHHLEIARMRALETGRYLLRATNTGIGDHRCTGRLRGLSPQFEQAILIDDVSAIARDHAVRAVGQCRRCRLAGLMLLPALRVSAPAPEPAPASSSSSMRCCSRLRCSTSCLAASACCNASG